MSEAVSPAEACPPECDRSHQPFDKSLSSLSTTRFRSSLARAGICPAGHAVSRTDTDAVQLGQGPKFSIDISKHEYTAGKTPFELDGFVVFVYTPEMIVCEKLRAICQQMPEYGPVVKRDRAGSSRARDFIDIHTIMSARNVDLTIKQNRELLAQVFASKRVKLSLLRNVDKYREFHRVSYLAVAATVKAGVMLKEFDFYIDFVLDLIKQLEPLGDE
jgi:Nucleotidyl transferase AbiEii toxin, Type IV TA system